MLFPDPTLPVQIQCILTRLTFSVYIILIMQILLRTKLRITWQLFFLFCTNFLPSLELKGCLFNLFQGFFVLIMSSIPSPIRSLELPLCVQFCIFEPCFPVTLCLLLQGHSEVPSLSLQNFLPLSGTGSHFLHPMASSLNICPAG